MKKLLLSLLLINFSLLAFAVPSVDNYIPDQAGEYVYYKDNTFSRESYIGILSYDSNTYQLKYFAPSTKSNPAEKNVVTLISTDLVDNHFDITGEKILVADYANQEDVDIINYLHDIMYEFASRRSKIGKITPDMKNYVNYDSLNANGVLVSADYAQFGGDVNIIYDVMIPFFNVKRIEDSKGKVLFECVQLGKINSADETLFDHYTTVPEIRKVKVNSLKQKKAKSVDYTYNDRKITLDTSWEKKLEYLFVQNDDAIISLASYVVPPTVTDEYYVLYTLARNLLESKDNNYIDFSKCEIIFADNDMKIFYDTYSCDTKNVFYTAKYITKINDNTYDYLSFAAKKANYLQKRSYFDKLIKNNLAK